MNIFSTQIAGLRIGIGVGILVALFTAPGDLYGQRPAATPSKPAPKPAPAARPAAPAARSTAPPAKAPGAPAQKAAVKPAATNPQRTPVRSPASSGGSTGAGKTGTATSAGTKTGSTGTKAGGATGSKTGAATGSKTSGAAGASATGSKTGGTTGTGATGSKTSGAAGSGTTGSKTSATTGSAGTGGGAGGTTVSHGPGGTTRIATMRGDHSGIVANQAGHGYVQKPFLYHNRQFVARTYYFGGGPYSLYYQGYPFRGAYLYGYSPYSYYGPAFYGWAYNPWLGPGVSYAWGWDGNPWYGYYGYYFSPYPAYRGASYWLTDYLISSSLQEAYQEQVDAQTQLNAQPAGGSVVITPEIKQAIATEIQNQIALENAEAQTQARGGDIDINSSGLPRILAETSPGHPHVFIVASPITVTDANGQQCGLTEGDILRISTPPSPTDTGAYVQVFASKNQECASGGMVLVGLADLQEMQNNMRATIDQGLQALQNRPAGLPAPPAAAATPAVPAGFASIAPPPDPNASTELQQEVQQGNAADPSAPSSQVQQSDALPARSGGTAPAARSVAKTLK